MALSLPPPQHGHRCLTPPHVGPSLSLLRGFQPESVHTTASLIHLSIQPHALETGLMKKKMNQSAVMRFDSPSTALSSPCSH